MSRWGSLEVKYFFSRSGSNYQFLTFFSCFFMFSTWSILKSSTFAAFGWSTSEVSCSRCGRTLELDGHRVVQDFFLLKQHLRKNGWTKNGAAQIVKLLKLLVNCFTFESSLVHLRLLGWLGVITIWPRFQHWNHWGSWPPTGPLPRSAAMGAVSLGARRNSGAIAAKCRTGRIRAFLSVGFGKHLTKLCEAFLLSFWIESNLVGIWDEFTNIWQHASSFFQMDRLATSSLDTFLWTIKFEMMEVVNN